MEQMFGYALNVYREKFDRPSTDLASQIVHAEVEGRSLDEVDFPTLFHAAHRRGRRPPRAIWWLVACMNCSVQPKIEPR